MRTGPAVVSIFTGVENRLWPPLSSAAAGSPTGLVPSGSSGTLVPLPLLPPCPGRGLGQNQPRPH